MHWLELQPLERTRRSDHEFLMKAPLLPNKYLIKKEGVTLALHQPPEKGQPYYLQTDHGGFYDSYRNYYELRFKTREMEGDFQLPEGYSPLAGGTPEPQTSEE